MQDLSFVGKYYGVRRGKPRKVGLALAGRIESSHQRMVGWRMATLVPVFSAGFRDQDEISDQESGIVMNPAGSYACSIAPWLSVRNGEKAVRFYKAAFGATEVYRLEDPGGGVVVRLSVDGAEFWLSDGSPESGDLGAEALGGGSVRMILTVANPDAFFAQALTAGASEIFPVGEEHGWRLGRLVDPMGLHWEIGRFHVE